MKKFYLMLLVVVALTGHLSAQVINKTIYNCAAFTIPEAAAASPAPSAYRWFENGTEIEGATTTTYTIVKDKPAGTYTYVRQAFSTNCQLWQSSNAYTVAVVASGTPGQPTAPTGVDVNGCDETGVRLTTTAVAGAASYVWYKGGVAAATTTALSYDVSSVGTDNYTVAGVNACGVAGVQSAGKQVTINALPSAPTVGTSGSYCDNVNITAATGSGGSSILWDNGTTASPRAITQSGTYWAKSVSAAGCTSTAGSSVTIVIVTTPAVPAIAQNGPKCAGTGITFTASGSSGNYDWSSPATGNGSTKVSSTAAGAYTGTVRAYTTNGVTCYSATTSTTGTVNALPTATVDALSINCNETATMKANVTVGSGSISSIRWYLGGVDQGTTTATTKATAALTATGSYYVTVTNSNACMVTSASATITVGSCAVTNPVGEVTLAGVTWAGSNVAAVNTFASSAGAYTQFYQWNRTVAYAATGSSSSPSWTETSITDESWTVNPCPTGWRLPTKDEWVALDALGSYWATNTNPGRWYGKASGCTVSTCIFLPAVGDRNPSDGSLGNQGSRGSYWSSTQNYSTDGYRLTFNSSSSHPSVNLNKAFGLSARCVK